jgi:hypothetical protein
MTRRLTCGRAKAGAVMMAVCWASGCSPADPTRESGSKGHFRGLTLPVALASGQATCEPGGAFCDEPNHDPAGAGSAPDFPIGALPAGDLTGLRGAWQVPFQSASPARWRAKLMIPLPGAGVSQTYPYLDVSAHGRSLRIINAWTPPAARAPRDRLVLDAGNRGLGQVRLTEVLQIDFTKSTPVLGAVGFTLEDQAAGVAVAHMELDFDLVAPPATCTDHALVRFGPIPWNMLAIHLPEREDCAGERCIRATEGWIRGLHHSWRLSQMFTVLDHADPLYRSFLWGQPATDAAGEPVGFTGGPSSPKYWFGGYSDERYFAIREGVLQMWAVFANAETETIDVHLQCPDYGENPGNICFSGSSYGHHSVLGWINVCSEGFDDAVDVYPNDQDAVTHTIIHESLHHLTVDLDAGPRYIRDTITHGHGSACVTDIDTQYIDGIAEVRHLATYVAADGEGCWHRNYALQAVESYANFAMHIGEGVRDGKLYHWPKLADPTPVPPDCDGEIGCQCVAVPVHEAPDGDYSSTRYCADHEEQPTVCMKTKFNASDTVGICTNCADRRGPGCPCNDLDLPCDEGFCWGDDTGPGNVTGTCYRDPPPSWGCLANCPALLGAGAFCLHDHPGGARCVPYGTGLPDLFDCWNDGGYFNADSECVTHECGPLATPVPATCQDLGYPSYFVCDGSFRCIPDP